jgi:putative ABC transport system substrate-binding protein
MAPAHRNGQRYDRSRTIPQSILLRTDEVPMIRALLSFAFATLCASLGPSGLASAADSREAAAPRRIGVLLVVFSPESREAQQFRQGLLDAGYSESHDVVIEWRFTNGDFSQVPELAADLVQRKMDIIVADTSVATRILKRATSTIPIVMTAVSDPVESGLVSSLARPTGNVTGFSLMLAELSAKRLQLLKELIPQVTQIAVLWNPDTSYQPKAVEDLKAVASSLAIKLSFVSVRAQDQLDQAFSDIGRAHAQALYVLDAPLFSIHRRKILELASKGRLPVMSADIRFAHAGALMAYGPSIGDLFYRSAGYAVKILRGAKPSDLPIEQPTKFELVVNLKSAKALGITIPESILLRADDVIR